MRTELERQLIDLPAVAPPQTLRARVLAAASPHVTASDSYWDRVWFSSRWRWAACAALVLIVGEAWAERQAPPLSMPLREDTTARIVIAMALDAGFTMDHAVAMAATALPSTIDDQGGQ